MYKDIVKRITSIKNEYNKLKFKTNINKYLSKDLITSLCKMHGFYNKNNIIETLLNYEYNKTRDLSKDSNEKEIDKWITNNIFKLSKSRIIDITEELYNKVIKKASEISYSISDDIRFVYPLIKNIILEDKKNDNIELMKKMGFSKDEIKEMSMESSDNYNTIYNIIKEKKVKHTIKTFDDKEMEIKDKKCKLKVLVEELKETLQVNNINIIMRINLTEIIIDYEVEQNTINICTLKMQDLNEKELKEIFKLFKDELLKMVNININKITNMNDIAIIAIAKFNLDKDNKYKFYEYIKEMYNMYIELIYIKSILSKKAGK